MTKENKYKEKTRIKILKNVSAEELDVMYLAITSPKDGKPFGIEDYLAIKDMKAEIVQDLERKNARYVFENRDKVVFTISQHEDMMRKLKSPIFSMDGAELACKLHDRLKEIESEDPEEFPTSGNESKE